MITFLNGNIIFSFKQVHASFVLKVQHISTKLAQTSTGRPIQYHLVIVVLGKAVGLGYALVRCSNPWYICIFYYIFTSICPC
jgi:hypothetical protein